MGHWGVESCSSDSCWDALYCKKLHEPTDKEISDSLNRLRVNKHYKHEWTEYSEVFVGVVIWGLDHECTVEFDALKESLLHIQKMLKDNEYLENWRSREEREAQLHVEKDIIFKAIQNMGKGTERHVRGLMEKICGGGK